MRKLLFLIIFCFVINISPAKSTEKTDYDNIYNNLPVLNFYYDHNTDPDESLDYQEFVNSPYPLIRISLNLTCKNAKISPGYYLIVPKNRSGYNFAMFKQNGKIVAMVPFYDKQLINPAAIYPASPKEKSAAKRFFKNIKNILGRPFKKYRRPLTPPRYSVNTYTVDAGRYFELWLYKEQYVYKMIFKIER